MITAHSHDLQYLRLPDLITASETLNQILEREDGDLTPAALQLRAVNDELCRRLAHLQITFHEFLEEHEVHESPDVVEERILNAIQFCDRR